MIRPCCLVPLSNIVSKHFKIKVAHSKHAGFFKNNGFTRVTISINLRAL